MRAPAIASLLVLASACAPLAGGPAAHDRAEKLAYQPTRAQPERCVQITNIRETRVLDDSTIDFMLRGGGRLRNTLPVGCPGLRFEDGISYSTSLSRLCNVDIVTALNRTGGGLQRGASCGLGIFQPVAKVVR